MIISKLTLNDFRAFSGIHEIDLKPRSDSFDKKPVVLFGGLNGAGKTTILMAIRLALYGRLALELGTTTKAYSQFIRESIHTSPGSQIPINSTFIELAFTHGKIGEESAYVVRRSWIDSGTEVKEYLELSTNGLNDHALSFDSIQGLLNDLVPIGVSDLFFFDGERISALAEDGSGRVLQTAFDRLYGLDLIDRLRNDLRVYLLRQQKERISNNERREIEELQSKYQFNLAQIRELKEELIKVQKEQEALNSAKDVLEANMLARGGEWNVSREEHKRRANELAENLKSQEKELRAHLAGVFPLNLAHQSLSKINDRLSQEFHVLTNHQKNQLLDEFSAELEPLLDAEGKRALNEVLKGRYQPVSSVSMADDMSIATISRLDRIVNHDLSEAKAGCSHLLDVIESASSDLDDISRQIEQAPDEAVLAQEFEELTKFNEHSREIEAQIDVQRNELKLKLLKTIELARLLRNKHLKVSEQTDSEQPMEYAQIAREALIEFRRSRTAQKLKDLETKFTYTFNRLLRKRNYIHKSRIDPDTYSVVLIDDHGHEMKKTNLSAGEKQIFAVAMLDALAKTSEHKLPVVIDTPLARLDSKHRTKLVSDYFTNASHQVILLSTDTEIDERFFNQLLPLTSHCFEIHYDGERKSSYVSEGYFWHSKNGSDLSDSS